MQSFDKAISQGVCEMVVPCTTSNHLETEYTNRELELMIQMSKTIAQR